MEITLIKRLDGLFMPAFDSDKRIADKIKVGDPITGKFRKQRNYQFLKKYMALLNLAYENYDTEMDFNEFRAEIIKRAGYYKEVINFKGNLEYIALSISFANMDEIVFSELYNKSLDVILKYVLKGNSKEEITQNVINFM